MVGWQTLRDAAGAEVYTLEFPLGTAIDPDVVEEELRRHDHVKLLGVVHGETSTGVLSPLEELAAVAHRHDALIIADTVSSLGGQEVAMDDWDVDICLQRHPEVRRRASGLGAHQLGAAGHRRHAFPPRRLCRAST